MPRGTLWHNSWCVLFNSADLTWAGQDGCRVCFGSDFVTHAPILHMAWLVQVEAVTQSLLTPEGVHEATGKATEAGILERTVFMCTACSE